MYILDLIREPLIILNWVCTAFVEISPTVVLLGFPALEGTSVRISPPSSYPPFPQSVDLVIPSFASFKETPPTPLARAHPPPPAP
jgi:hypothetical protein